MLYNKIALSSLLAFAILGVALPSARAIDYKQAKFTQVVNDVNVLSIADQSSKPANVNDRFKLPDVLRTGLASRAELVGEDMTVTRVGANTIFSFDAAMRTIDLKQGSLLFHSPKGKGGGSIRSGSVTATVLGTTIICSVTADGGFKVLVLEGQCEVRYGNNQHEILGAGQMTFVQSGGQRSAGVLNFRLDEQTRGSKLVTGFDQPLASTPLIDSAIEKQNLLIQKGKIETTTLLVGDTAVGEGVAVIEEKVISKTISGILPASGGATTASIAGLSGGSSTLGTTVGGVVGTAGGLASTGGGTGGTVGSTTTTLTSPTTGGALTTPTSPAAPTGGLVGGLVTTVANTTTTVANTVGNTGSTVANLAAGLLGH